MKRLLGLMVVVMAVTGIIGLAYGGDTDSIQIKVTMVTNIEVDIADAEYNFGILNSGETSDPAAYVTQVQNTSADNREDWRLNLTDPANWAAITLGSPGPEQFMLMAQFADNSGTKVTWDSTNHALSTSLQYCSLDKFGNNVYGECGLDVPTTTDTRNLWFRLTMPSESAFPGTEQTIAVTVTASAG